MKIHRLLLPSQEREILKICDDLNTYWRTNDNFEVAIKRYFEDLTYKYRLGLTTSEIQEIVNQINIKLFGDFNISYANAIYVFAQFFIFFIFKGSAPKQLVIDSEDLLKKVVFIENHFIQPETKLDGFKVVLGK